MGAPRKTSLTVVVRPVDSAKSIRVTYWSDGKARRGKKGPAQLFDPETAMYATSGMVVNLVANSATESEHPILMVGDRISSARLLEASHTWKRWLTLDEILEHASLGATAPSKETIVAAYRELRDQFDAEG